MSIKKPIPKENFQENKKNMLNQGMSFMNLLQIHLDLGIITLQLSKSHHIMDYNEVLLIGYIYLTITLLIKTHLLKKPSLNVNKFRGNEME